MRSATFIKPMWLMKHQYFDDGENDRACRDPFFLRHDHFDDVTTATIENNSIAKCTIREHEGERRKEQATEYPMVTLRDLRALREYQKCWYERQCNRNEA